MKFFWKSLLWFRKIILYKIFKLSTRGVRIIIINNKSFLLIKHPYDDFWVFPGGSIKKNESDFSAAKRETLEEVGLEIDEINCKKLGKYQNLKNGKNDEVTVFVTDLFKKSQKRRRIIDKIEIQDQRWFRFENLPKISQSTRLRINEVLKNEYSSKIREW